MAEHREAINCDLMKRGYTLDDVGGALTWDALGDFISKTEPGSALSYDLDPERADWATTDRTNTLLADIYDLLAVMNRMLATMVTQRRQPKPKPYRRPGKDKNEKRHVGTASIPIADVKNEILKRLRGQKNG